MSESTLDAITLEALYNINKHADKYADLGTKNYRRGKKATAHANALKKDALYGIKTRVITDHLDDTDRVERHFIRGTPHWCCYFVDEMGDEWSFHSPMDVLDAPISMIEQTRRLDDFEKTGDKDRSTNSLKASLLHIEAVYGLNANDYLEETHVSYGYKSHFVGWKYLGDGGKLMAETARQTESDKNRIECEECGQLCKGERGLSIHQTMTHGEDDAGGEDDRREDSRLEVDDPEYCRVCGWPLNSSGVCQPCVEENENGDGADADTATDDNLEAEA